LSRGILYNLIARGLFVISAYVIHIYLGRALGPERYGVFGVVLSVLMVCYIFLNNGVRQVIARLITYYPECTRHFLKKGLFVQILISGVIAALVFCFSGMMADFFKDSRLSLPLKLCSAVVVVQGIYFVYTGALSGQKRFFAESVVLSTYGIMRPAMVLILVALGFGVPGAIGGFFIASAMAIAVGTLTLAKAPEAQRDVSVKEIFDLAIPTIVIFGAVAMILNLDVLSVKRFLFNDEAAGFYTAATTFSKPPYWFLFSFGSVALPLVASCYSRGDAKQSKIYVSQVLRYSGLVLLPLLVIISATATDLIIFCYRPGFEPAGVPLSILIFGVSFAGLVTLMAHLMIAINKEWLMAVMALVGVILDLVLNIVLVPSLELIGAALATTISAGALLLASGIFIFYKIGFDLLPLTILRMGILLLVLYFAARLIPGEDIWLLVKYVGLYGGFCLVLIVTHEIGPEDWTVVKHLVKRPER